MCFSNPECSFVSICFLYLTFWVMALVSVSVSFLVSVSVAVSLSILVEFRLHG